MTTESVLSRLKAYLSSISDVTLYEGHPAVLVNEAVGAIDQLDGDLSYAKNALDRETARALKFGKEITSLEAKVAELQEALKQIVADYDTCSGAEPSLSVLHRSIDVDGRRALEQSK